MTWWPAVAVVGFFLLSAAVVALGRMSTARYEREQSRAAEKPDAQGEHCM
ncbi:hypothetical protein [Modestobacter italicus]|nr:hypothetical protein [Modestobacter marinus]